MGQAGARPSHVTVLSCLTTLSSLRILNENLVFKFYLDIIVDVDI